MNNFPLAPLLAALQAGQIIAYPTEAVFGLGCDPDSEQAVRRLLALKQRPPEKGLILVAADYTQLQPYIDDSSLTQARREAIFACWPGPVSFIFPARADTPRWLTGRFSSLAVRVSAHPPVLALCRAYGKPLVSTSANRSGQAPCRTSEQIVAQFSKAITVLHAATGGHANPSEIRDAITGRVIRRG